MIRRTLVPNANLLAIRGAFQVKQADEVLTQIVLIADLVSDEDLKIHGRCSTLSNIRRCTYR